MSGDDFNALFLPMKQRAGIIQFDKGLAELDEADKALLDKVFADQRGATMVMGVFMAAMLVGMIYYVWGIGGAVVHCRTYKVYDGKVQLPRSLGSFSQNGNTGDPVTFTVLGFTQQSEDIDGNPHPPQAPNPRKFDGYYVVLGLNLHPVTLNAGYGITRVFATDNDFVAAKKNRFDPIKTQQGISAGINYAYGEHLVLALEYFHAKHTWYFGETQDVNVANAGLTVLW